MAGNKNEFEQGRFKHLLFRSKLRAILLGAAIDEAPVLSEHDCPFGVWMQNYLLKACAGYPELKEMESLHTQLHRETRQVVKQYHAGNHDNELALASIESLGSRILILLSALEAKCTSENA